MKEIPLTQNKATLVDDEDYEWLNQWDWYAQLNHGNWYVGRSLNPGTLFMHRVLLGIPRGYECDHIDGDGLNNQRFNLRICTTRQNSYNQISLRGASRFKGVSLHKRMGKWRAYITFNGKRIHLGLFNSEIVAALSYDKAALNYFGEYARLNFSDSDVANFQVTSL